MTERKKPEHNNPEKSPAELFSGDRWEVPSDVSLVSALDREIEKRLLAAGYDPEKAIDLMLGIHEAVLNAMKHGNKEDPAKKVIVNVQISPETVNVEIEDEGLGYEHAKRPDHDRMKSSGRGLQIYIEPYFDMAFNESGNKITLTAKK